MLKQLCCDTPNRRVQVGWVSFMPDGSISIGSNDKTFISPKQKIRLNVWNAYNRVKYKFGIIHSPDDELQGIRNPHFTFHPPLSFHLKAEYPKNEEIFKGIADVALAVAQNGKLPWARLISAPLSQMQPQKPPRSGSRINYDPLLIRWSTEAVSVQFTILFVPVGAIAPTQADWIFSWYSVTVMISMAVTYPQISTLTWFHEA